MKQLLYKLFIEKTEDTKIQFLRYIFVGGTAAVVNIGSLFILKECFHLNLIIANILGFLLGLITNYLFSKALVFTKENTMGKVAEFATYAIIGVMGLGIDTFLVWLLTDMFAIYYMVSKIISTFLVFIWNFGARKMMYKVLENHKVTESIKKEKLLKFWKETFMLGIILLLIVIGIRVGVYHLVLTKDYEGFMDTQTYSYLENYRFEKFNSFRTPVYPLFIRIIGLFGDTSTDQLYTNVATAQELISLVSVFVFYLVMRKLTKNKIVQSVGTLWYGCLPSIFSYNLCILTESLSISVMVIFFYTFICYLQNKKMMQQILLAIETLFLILLRPSFLYLLIFFAIFWAISLLKEKENRKKVGIGILTTVIVGIGIWGYAKINQMQNGIKGLSYVNVINQADIIIGMRLYGSYENDPKDDAITQIIVEGVEEESGPWYSLKEKIPYKDLEGYMKKCVKYNRKSYIIANIRKLLELGNNNINTVVASGEPSQELVQTKDLITLSGVALPVTFSFCYFIIALEVITFIWNQLRKKEWTQKAQIRFYAILLIGGMLAVTILGAQAEYQRLVAPILPIIIVVCACYLEKMTEKEKE